MIKLKVLGTRVQLKIDEPKAGALDLSSMNVAKEIGEVIGIGEEVTTLKVGDRVMFKSWSVDIVTDGVEKFYFIDMKTGGVCAIIK